ncbi:MAG TPA: hypothetical protein VKS79_26485 [Gemmataceae bacterium]|nr:hypothetical protein [Gemmataceae bacterium]
MTVSITCRCGKRLQTRDELAGKPVKCPACGTVLKVPAAGKRCPSCGSRLPTNAVLYVSCGLDLRTGTKLITVREKPTSTPEGKRLLEGRLGHRGISTTSYGIGGGLITSQFTTTPFQVKQPRGWRAHRGLPCSVCGGKVEVIVYSYLMGWIRYLFALCLVMLVMGGIAASLINEGLHRHENSFFWSGVVLLALYLPVTILYFAQVSYVQRAITTVAGDHDHRIFPPAGREFRDWD